MVSARRLPLVDAAGRPCDDSHVTLEVELAGGDRDLVVALDPERAPEEVHQRDWKVSLCGEVGWVRAAAEEPTGPPRSMALMNGRQLRCGGQILADANSVTLLESGE